MSEDSHSHGVDPEIVERALLGRHQLDRQQVADKAGVPLELARELWSQLGFPQTEDGEIAFTRQDVKALERTHELISLGILDEETQAALVRTWGRSFARLAEWQVHLLAELAAEGAEPEERLAELMAVAVPNVQKLQAYVWRRHLASAASRLLTSDEGGTSVEAVCFVDIVGYTSQSKSLEDSELVAWVEHFERTLTDLVVQHGGRVIKTIGDEVLFVAEDPFAAAEVALSVTALGEDEDDPFPRVRAGLAVGPVVLRLGDVFGSTVNLASRLTSVARPGTVLVDREAMEALSVDPLAPPPDPDREPGDAGGGVERLLGRAVGEIVDRSPYRRTEGYRFRRLPRRPVKGYRRLEPWLLRRQR